MNENINYQLEGYKRAEAERTDYHELEKELADNANIEMDVKLLRELYILVLIKRAMDCVD